MNRLLRCVCVILACAVASTESFVASAQAPAGAGDSAAPAATPAAPPGIEALAWLRGCWAGKVDRYDFVEQWLPPRAGMMLGVSHTLAQDRKQPGEVRTEDYEYLRLETRADGVYYLAIPSTAKEMPFKLTGVDSDQGDKIFTFRGSGDAFPQRIVYRHTKAGSLYAEVAGKVEGRDKVVTYPMHPVDCATGAPPRE